MIRPPRWRADFQQTKSRSLTNGFPSRFDSRVIKMKARSLGIAFAALLVLGRPVVGHAEDAASKSAATPTAPAAAQTDAPASVPRPSIAPKTAEPAPAATEDARPRRHRRYARHQHRRYAYWQPFPVYWPHFHRNRIYWNRMPWFTF